MNYKIIQNETILKQFIDWLPDLTDNEQYYVSLLARNKYSAILSKDKIQLKRFTSNKQFLFNKIKQIECEIGSYKDGDNDIPNESLVLYITPNPRDLEKATKNSLKLFVELITKPYNGYNPHSEVLNEIHKSISRMKYFDYDFDKVNLVDTMKQVYKIVNHECINILITNNGFHVLIDNDKLDLKYKKTLYNDMSKIYGVDKRGDNLIPIPGTIQGNHIPYFYDNETLYNLIINNKV